MPAYYLEEATVQSRGEVDNAQVLSVGECVVRMYAKICTASNMLARQHKDFLRRAWEVLDQDNG